MNGSTSLSPEADFDVALLLDSVRRMLERGADDWDATVAMGLVSLGDQGGRLEDIVRVAMEFGRGASSLPFVEAVIANRFATGLVTVGARLALGLGEIGGDVATGRVVARGDRINGTLRLVEGAATADLLAVLTTDGMLCAVAPKGEGVTITPTPALAAGFGDIHLDEAPVEARVDLGDRAGDMLAALRLCLCARALGAAMRGFDLAVDYANVRKQFGQAIGSFQAIQHKLANSHIALSACSHQLAAAARAFDAGAAQWRPLAAAAVAFGGPALRKVALETQHAFGAIGFAEEHEAPTLFRRVHADVARLGGAHGARDVLGTYILDGPADALAALLADDIDPAANFRARFRAWLVENWTDADRARIATWSFEERDWDLDFLARLGKDGWTTVNWPADGGGMGASPFEQLAFIEELQKAEAPEHSMICSCRIIAPEVIAHGSERLKAELLPGLRAGSVTGCLGYSEPESGSDLASLRTLAIRDGDDYVINGQKIWTSDGQRASHMILAARTNPDPAARHGGITMFILPMDGPGITIRTMTGLHGHIFCNIFFDDVRLPAHHRLGEEGQGWSILSNALANERINMGGFVSRLAVLLGKVIDTIRAEPALLADRSARRVIGDLAARLVAGRMLAIHSIAETAAGRSPLVEAAMAKVYASELAQQICEEALDLLGGQALLATDTPGAPAGGLIDEILRLSIMYVVGGGSNEIQRSLIAGRGLRLGR